MSKGQFCENCIHKVVCDHESKYRKACSQFLEARPHGTWESKNGTRYCSNCKKMAIYVPSVYGPSALLTDFCPNCGADMREGDRNDRGNA